MNITNLRSLFEVFFSNFGLITIWDFLKIAIDITVVSYAMYRLILLVRQTRAWQLIKGIIFIIVSAKVSEFLGLKTIAFVLNQAVQYIAIALVVLFQPELRRGLEQIGRSRFRSFFGFDEEVEIVKTSSIIEEIVKATIELSNNSIGAILVIERDTKIGEVINAGVELNATITSELIKNIFSPNTPLHDGAVVIRGDKIMAATCFLPLTDNPNLSKGLGTRHRAALGITEVSDALVIAVSEETGIISSCQNGGLTRNLNSDTLRKLLNKNLIPKNNENKKMSLWKMRAK